MPKYTTSEVWAERYKLASGQQTKLFKRFSNWYDSLYAVVGTQPAPWRSKVYVPMLARQTWALVAKFLTLKPGFNVRVASPDGETDDIDDKAEKARRKLEFDYENPYLDETMREKLFAPLLDAVVTGTGMAKVKWCVEDKVSYSRNVDENGHADLSKEKKTTEKNSYNDLEPVNIFNVFVSPAAINLYSAPWIIIKDYKTLAELKKLGIYNNLDKLENAGGIDDEFEAYNFSRNRLTSSQSRKDDTITNIKIYECYEGDNIQTFAEVSEPDSDEAWIPLLERQNPYWHGKYPLVKFHIKKRAYDFWGEGIFETTYRLQSAYNDVYNHFLDQWNLAENSMLMVRENANVNDYIVQPGGTITYRGDQPPVQFKHAMPDARALETILTYLDQAVEGVTISQYAAGLPNSDTDKTKGTATGITKLQEAAGDLVSFMRQNFSQSLTQIGRMWLSNNQQFMDKPVNIVVMSKGKKQTMKVTPQDMQGQMDLMIDESSMDPSSQDDKTQRFIAYTQLLEGLQTQSLQQAQATRWTTDPLYINYAAVLQDASDIMNRTQFDKYLLSTDQVEAAMKASQSPMIMPNERVTITPQDLTANEMGQILQRNGIQPDPSRQQGVITPGDQVALADAKASLAKAGQVQQQQQDPTAVTPDHLIKAQQAQHKQSLDEAKLAMQAHKQNFELAQSAHAHQFDQSQATDQQNFDQENKTLQFMQQAAQSQEQEKAGGVKGALNKVRGKK